MSTTTLSDSLNDNALRKAWLKQTFGSHAYHEELLRLHQQFKTMIRRALERPEARRDHRESYDYFVRVAMPVIDSVPMPGTGNADTWKSGVSRGFSGNIPDYSRYISEDAYWTWMPMTEQIELGHIWSQMNQICTNIRRTVDRTWFQEYFGNDNELLDVRSTGPIDWPDNWRNEILGEYGATLVSEDAIRIKAGEPAPEQGTYVALDPRDRRFTVAAGERLPDLNSSYGITVWQRVSG